MADTIRWGILSTGNIAKQFARGLVEADDAKLVSVGSRTQEAADAFGNEFDVPNCHASYEALAGDPEVDAIYVATPHPMHKRDAITCLEGGKAVLCEKPFTVNANEAREVIEFARMKKLFLLEAMWTRFIPAIVKVREIIDAGEIGDVKMAKADFCFRAGFDPESRLFKPELGGGGLLDIGIYVISFARMIMKNAPLNVVSLADFGQTGVDEQAGMVMSYGGDRMALLTCATRTNTPHVAQIFGTEGYITVHHAFWHSEKLTVVRGDKEETLDIPFKGNGYTHEAEEVGACLRAGKLESDVLPLDETLSIMKTLDWVRAQWNLEYPFE